MTDAENEAAALAHDATWEEANAAAVESAKMGAAGAEAGKGAAETAEDDAEMDTGDDAAAQPIAQDLR